MKKGQKAIFIDRDGTLIEEVNFLSRIEDLRFFPFTDDAVKLLKQNGYLMIVVTNQSGIGRKLFEARDMHSIHDEIQSLLTEKVDGFYFCPHLPDEGCECRKPGLGMINAACRDFEIDLENSWMIGDKRIDIETGFNAGIKTAAVMTGYGRRQIDELERRPDVVAKDLWEAASAIVNGGIMD